MQIIPRSADAEVRFWEILFQRFPERVPVHMPKV